jgi:hypothetical protein
LLKEFNLEKLTNLEKKLLDNIIINLNEVTPSAFLKLLYNLASFYLFELNSKKINTQKSRKNIINIDMIFTQVPSLIYLQKISNQQYSPENFSSAQLKESIPYMNSMLAFENTIILDLFPKIREHMARIISANINKNFSDRKVVNRLFKISEHENNLRMDLSTLFLDRFANALANYACVNEQLEQVFDRLGISIFRNDISDKIFKFTSEFSISQSFFRQIAKSFASNSKNSDTKKLGLFIESCFFFVFPIFFYCHKFKQRNLHSPKIDPFFHYSVDFLLYICNISRALIRKIKDYNLEEKISKIKNSVILDHAQKMKKIARIHQINENNLVLLEMLKGTLLFNKRHYEDLDLDPRSLMLKRNVQSLISLLK